MTNPDLKLDYKVVLKFITSEMRAILRVVEPDSLCFYLLTDTLKHADHLDRELEKENPGV